MDIKTRDRYLDVYEVAIINGLLFKEVWYSLDYRKPTPTTGQTFAFIR